MTSTESTNGLFKKLNRKAKFLSHNGKFSLDNNLFTPNNVDRPRRKSRLHLRHNRPRANSDCCVESLERFKKRGANANVKQSSVDEYIESPLYGDLLGQELLLANYGDSSSSDESSKQSSRSSSPDNPLTDADLLLRYSSHHGCSRSSSPAPLASYVSPSILLSMHKSNPHSRAQSPSAQSNSRSLSPLSTESRHMSRSACSTPVSQLTFDSIGDSHDSRKMFGDPYDRRKTFGDPHESKKTFHQQRRCITPTNLLPSASFSAASNSSIQSLALSSPRDASSRSSIPEILVSRDFESRLQSPASSKSFEHFLRILEADKLRY